MHNDPQGIEELLSTEAVTRRSGADRFVEGKHLWLERRHAVAADWASMPAGEHHLRLRRIVEEGQAHQPTRKSQCGLEGFSEALRAVRPYAHAIDDRLDSVFALRIEFWERFHFVDAAIDAGSHEALRRQAFQHVGVLAFAVIHEGREQSGR